MSVFKGAKGIQLRNNLRTYSAGTVRYPRTILCFNSYPTQYIKLIKSGP